MQQFRVYWEQIIMAPDAERARDLAERQYNPANIRVVPAGVGIRISSMEGITVDQLVKNLKK